MQRFLLIYFITITVLAGIACTQGGALMLLIMFPPLGLLTVAAPTILLYSFALAPLGAALMAPHRHIALIAATTLIPVALAVGPGLLSGREAKDFATRMGAQDFDRPMTSKPRSIELAGDPGSGMWIHGHSVGDKAAWCNEICTRLLINGEVDWVRMTTLPDRSRSTRPQSVIYRVEHRDICPELPADHRVEKTVRDRLVTGDCLISAPDDSHAPDTVVKLTTLYADWSNTLPPDGGLPGHTNVRTVKSLRIESRQEAAISPLLQQTETVTRPLALPFYFGAAMDMQCGKCNGATVGRDTVVTKPIDLAQALRHTLGYALAEISAPPAEPPRQVSEGLLTLPASTASTFSTQQQDVLSETLTDIAKKQVPSDTDIDLIRRVIADDRVTNSMVGISIQNMSRRNPASFEPLIPTILDRMMVQVDQRSGHYKGTLGWSLQNMPADTLRPYSDRMISIVTNQPDWTTNGILIRLAELGSNDAINLVIQRLDTKRSMSSPRQFAAIAICRAGADTWPRLEPAVLAHLTPGRQNGIDDDEAALLLALVRFGEKSQAIDIVQKRSLANMANVIERLNKLEPNFDPKHCRARL
jgi:hypothetical protein